MDAHHVAPARAPLTTLERIGRASLGSFDGACEVIIVAAHGGGDQQRALPPPALPPLHLDRMPPRQTACSQPAAVTPGAQDGLPGAGQRDVVVEQLQAILRIPEE